MSIECPECQRLQLAYAASIQEIYAVVNGSFKTVREKMNRLFETQDIRDKAVQALHRHKRNHSRKVECRRSFRCAAELPVVLMFTASKKTFQCWTMNVSGNGMAIKTPVSLRPAGAMNIALLLPEVGTLRATGVVIWDDKHGKCGLTVRCSGAEMRKKLDSWLDSKFATMN